MPCSEQVRVIEGALLSLTEADSKALEERRRIQKLHKDAADRERQETFRKSPPPTYWEIVAAQEKATKPRRNGNVIAGPWDAGGEARPPAKKPISRQERLHQIFNVAHVMAKHGLGPEDLPADTDPTTRRLTELLMEAPSKRDPDGDNAA